MMKGLDERIDEGVLRWVGHVERMSDRNFFEIVESKRSKIQIATPPIIT